MKFHETWRLIRHREAVDTLAAHLEHTYNIDVTNLAQLDAGVYRVDRRDGPAWVARMFPAVRPFERAQGDADVLRFLEPHDFPAERLAHADPLSMHAGQAVLVTEFVDGSQLADRSEQTFHALGEMLGRLHTLPAAAGGVARQAGAIHAFTLDEGSLADEVADAMSWLAEAEIPAEHKSSYDELREQMSRIDFGDHLPQALLHPDPVPKNFIATPAGNLVAIDWTGAGRGPRAHSLAFLLLCAVRESRWKADSPRADAVIEGYRKHVQLEDAEFPAIADAMPLHVLVGDCATFCLGRTTFDEVAGGYSVISRLATKAADRIRQAVRT